MRKRPLWSVVVAVVALMVLVTACGSSGSTSAGTSSDTAPAGSGGGASGTLTIGTFGQVQSFDPALAQPSSGVYIDTVYDTLLHQDADGKLAANLATKWSQPDPSTWSFTLRTDVTFTDGTPFNAAAVKANLLHDKSTPGPNQSAFVAISSIETPSPDKVVVHFSAPNPSFGTDMSTTKGAMASPKAIKAGTLAKAPVGTGGWAYDAGRSQPGVKYVFTANPDYWNKAEQKVKAVEIRVLADNNARVNALKTGAVDLIDAVFANQVEDLKAAGAQIVQQPDQVILMFLGDRNGTTVPALGKQKVRRAMNLAINRKAILNKVGQGLGDASATIFAKGSKWYVPANADLLKYNPTKARKLLAEAGYPDGFTFSVPVFGTTQAQNQVIAQQLAAVGITMKLETVPPGTAGPEFRKQKFPAVFGPVSVVHPNDFWSVFVRESGGWDPFKVSTDKIDALALQAAKAASPAEQKKLYGQMEAEILKEGVFLVEGHAPILAAASPKVSGDLFIEDGGRSISPLGLSVSG